MLYAILCYDDEAKFDTFTQEDEEAVMARLALVEKDLSAGGRLAATARLQPTTSATTVRKGREPPLVIDGPFAETKEQLLGFWMVECATLEEALDTARDLARASGSTGAYEVRPVSIFRTGSAGAT
jgi:hypothetical protein